MKRYRVTIKTADVTTSRRFEADTVRDALWQAAAWAWEEFGVDVRCQRGKWCVEGGPPPLGITEFTPEAGYLATDFARRDA